MTSARIALVSLAIACGAWVGCADGGGTGGADGGDTDTQSNSPCGFTQHSSVYFTLARVFEIDYPYLFAVGADRLAVLDISDLANPQIVAGNDGALAGHGTDSALEDGVLWVVDAPWLFSFDVSTPTADPPMLEQLPLDLPDVNRIVRRAAALVIAEVTSYSPDSSAGTSLYVLNDGSYILHEHPIADGWFTALTLAGEQLYTGFEYHDDLAGTALLTVDVTDPDDPSIADESATEAQPTAIAVDGDRLCAVAGGRLLAYSLADPAAPAVLGELDGEQVGGDRLVVEGDFAYAGGCSAIDVIDISSPEQPALFDSLDIDPSDEGQDNCLTALAIGSDGAGHAFLAVGREYEISFWSLCAP